MFLVRISIKKEAGGRFFLLFIISYCMLSLHITTFPQGCFLLELLGQRIISMADQSDVNYDTFRLSDLLSAQTSN